MCNTYDQAQCLWVDLAKLSEFLITMDDSLRHNDFGNHLNPMPKPYHHLDLRTESIPIFVEEYFYRHRRPTDCLCMHMDPFDLQDLEQLPIPCYELCHKSENKEEKKHY